MVSLTLDEIADAISAKIAAPVAAQAHAGAVRVTGVSTDSRTVAEGDLFFALSGPRFDGHSFLDAALAKAAAAVVQRSRWPGGEAPAHKPVLLVSDTTEALGALAAYYRSQFAGTVIAVTGSNGKTTTKSMIHHLLSAHRRGRAAERSYNNAIGVPLTLLSAERNEDYIVVELGTSGPGEIERLARLASPNMAVITGVAEAHIEGLRDVHGVAVEKASVLKQLRRGGLAVVNVDRPEMRHLLSGPDGPGLTSGGPLLTCGAEPDADLRLTACRQEGRVLHFTINGRIELTMRATGRHNAINALAAFAIARRMGMSEDQIVERLAKFSPPAARLERRRAGVLEILDDSYNANPGSMEAALSVLRSLPTQGRRVLIAGEMRELGPDSEKWHAWLGREAACSPIQVLVAVGAQSRVVVDAARAALKANGRNGRRGPRLCAYPTAKEAAAQIGELLEPGDLVLIKGSRAVGLERVVHAVVRWGRREARASGVPEAEKTNDTPGRRATPTKRATRQARAAS